MKSLAEDIEKYPDSYQYERVKKINVTQGAIWFALKRLGVTYKKTLNHTKADTRLRSRFESRMHKYRIIVSIDEAGFQMDTPITHGYSKKGNRCYGFYDWNLRKRVNAIGAQIGTALLTVALFYSNIDTNIFTAWVNFHKKA